MSTVSFKIAITGRGVLPETTRAGDLAEFVVNVEKAISETAKARGVALCDEDIVSLTDIEKSSNKLTFTVAALLLPVAGAISAAVKTSKYESLPRQAHKALHDISGQAVKKNWKVQFIEERSLSIEGGEISSERPVPEPPVAPSIRGTTSIYGRCIRVGGVQPRAEIERYQGGKIYIDVSEQLAKDLAKRLYDAVCLQGVATWNSEDWTIETFECTEISEFSEVNVAQAFEQVAAAAKGKWAAVDAVKYVEALRSEGEKE